MKIKIFIDLSFLFSLIIIDIVATNLFFILYPFFIPSLTFLTMLLVKGINKRIAFNFFYSLIFIVASDFWVRKYGGGTNDSIGLFIVNAALAVGIILNLIILLIYAIIKNDWVNPHND